MGNTHTHAAAQQKPFFIVERILTPDIKVGVVGGNGGANPQGIRIGDGEIRRLKRFDSDASELNYTFENATKLRLYNCGPSSSICYTLESPELQQVAALYPSIVEKFKPISMGDTTTEIDAMWDLFRGKT